MAPQPPLTRLATASNTSTSSQATLSNASSSSWLNIWELPICIAADYHDIFYQDGAIERNFAALDERPEIKIDVQQCVQLLGQAYQQIFDLLYQKGLSQTEAALEMGLSQPRIAQIHAELLILGQHHLAAYAA